MNRENLFFYFFKPCQSSLLRESSFTLVPTASAISSICPADSLIVCAVIAWDSRFSTSTSLYSRPRARARCQGTSPDLHQKGHWSTETNVRHRWPPNATN